VSVQEFPCMLALYYIGKMDGWMAPWFKIQGYSSVVRAKIHSLCSETNTILLIALVTCKQHVRRKLSLLV